MADKRNVTSSTNQAPVIEPSTQKRSRTLQKKHKQREVNQDGAKIVRDPAKPVAQNIYAEYANSLNEKRKSERYLSSHAGKEAGKQKAGAPA